MNGRIIKIISNDYFVLSDNKTYICKSRGKFRKENISPKVGDYVFFDDKNNYILEVKERFNTLDRPVVSNINQAFIITSLKHPDFSSNLLDKLLVVCLLNKIEPVIVLTKKDLLKKDEYKNLKKIIKYYKKIGFKVLYNTEKWKIKRCFKNKTTVFTGQTGAGKSSLLNRLDKTLNFEVNEISEALGRGKHTTRYTTLVPMYKGFVLDTPGFSDIDLSFYSKEQIRDAFIEFDKISCPYKDCMHTFEKECEIKKEVGNKILKSRYENYLKFIKKLV